MTIEVSCSILNIGECMTNEELRELDAWIAENVMGYKVGYLGPNRRFCMRAPNAPVGQEQWVPKYSTDIAAAWEVFDRLPELGEYGTWKVEKDRNHYYCMFTDDEPYEEWVHEGAETASLAICLAAKKWKESQ